MLAFNLAISCLTVSNSPLFTELTFHVSMQYRSLQHWILLSSPDTSRTESFSHFGCFILSGAISNCHPFFPSSIRDTFRPEGFISWCHIFLPFHTPHGVLLASIWDVLPFPPPVDHVLSALSAMTRPSWVALNGMAHSFIELRNPLRHKAVIHEERMCFSPV